MNHMAHVGMQRKPLISVATTMARTIGAVNLKVALDHGLVSGVFLEGVEDLVDGEYPGTAGSGNSES